MKLLLTKQEPVPLPNAADLMVLGDLAVEGRVQVLVGGAVVFAYERGEDGDWRRAGAFTAARGHALDARWLGNAQALADRALRGEIEKGGGDEQVADTYPCPECGKILCSPAIVRLGRVLEVECGVEHVLRSERRACVLHPTGLVEWLDGEHAATSRATATQR